MFADTRASPLRGHARSLPREEIMATGSVVLVHGGFVDGSGWEGVYGLLTKDGYDVSVTQHPTLSLEDDAAAVKRIVDAQGGPVVLVGHSYGGAVITEAGTDPTWRRSCTSRLSCRTRASR
jgi:pimeloyl-ACP methyl ester carboxylesterase